MTRLNFDWSEAMAAALGELAESEGVPRAEIIRRALSWYRWTARERRAGTRFLVQRGDSVTEIEFQESD